MPSSAKFAALLLPLALGLAAAAPAAAQERCDGTLCDLYYRNAPAPWDDERPAAQPVTAATATSAVPVADTDPDGTPEPARTRHVAERPEPTACAATGRDPWACYR